MSAYRPKAAVTEGLRGRPDLAINGHWTYEPQLAQFSQLAVWFRL